MADYPIIASTYTVNAVNAGSEAQRGHAASLTPGTTTYRTDELLFHPD